MELLLLTVVPYIILYTCIFAALYFKPRVNGAKPSTDDRLKLRRPLVSVIVPFRNEADNLPHIIADLALQDWPSSLTEIVLVDDRSTDGSYSLASYLASGLENCRLVHNNGTGKKNAIATAIAITGGELILTTDADCRLNPGWLSSMACLYREQKADLVIGPVYPANKQGILNSLLRLEAVAIQSVTEATAISGHPVMASGANLAFSRELSNGYIDYIRPEIISGDDMFLLHRAKRDKKIIVFNKSKEAGVLTEPPADIKGIFSQRRRWAGKSISYHDRDTVVMALITSLTNILIALLLVLSPFIQGLFRIALAAWLMKSVPDLLLLLRPSCNMSRWRIMIWFLPLQLLYPFYVTIVTLAGLLKRQDWK